MNILTVFMIYSVLQQYTCNHRMTYTLLTLIVILITVWNRQPRLTAGHIYIVSMTRGYGIHLRLLWQIFDRLLPYSSTQKRRANFFKIWISFFIRIWSELFPELTVSIQPDLIVKCSLNRQLRLKTDLRTDLN